MEFESELQSIIEQRKLLYRLDAPIIICLIIAVAAQYFLPIMSPVFGVLAFALFYRRIYRAAHSPCPRCNAPFGSAAKVILGPGTNECQNCKLALYAQKS